MVWQYKALCIQSQHLTKITIIKSREIHSIQQKIAFTLIIHIIIFTVSQLHTITVTHLFSSLTTKFFHFRVTTFFFFFFGFLAETHLGRATKTSLNWLIGKRKRNSNQKNLFSLASLSGWNINCQEKRTKQKSWVLFSVTLWMEYLRRKNLTTQAHL